MTTPTLSGPGAGEEDQPDQPRTRDLPRRQDHALRRVRPQRHLRAHRRGLLRDGRAAGARHQAVGHRLLEQEPGVLPRRVARLQLGPRPHAGRGDRRRAGQQAPDAHWRQRRRRYRRHRRGPVRPPDAPQHPDHLHRREQRLLRPDEGPAVADGRPRVEAQERRGQRPAADGPVRAGHPAGRDVRGAVVLGRQEAAVGAAQGRHRATRARCSSTSFRRASRSTITRARRRATPT